MLVDFGRAIDLSKFSNDYEDVRKVTFCGDACKDDLRCVTMRNGKPWSFDIDTFGILCSVHVLLHGTHMEIRKGRNKQWVPVKPFKRYWKKELWNEIFGSLLNLDEQSGAAIGSRAGSLRALRQQIDSHLVAEEKSLRHFLKRQVNLLPFNREDIG